MTPTSFNIHSIPKTKLYRSIRDRIMSETGLTELEIRDLIGPMIAQAQQKTKQQETAMSIAVSMLKEHGGVSRGLVVQAGGKVVLKDTEKAQAKPKKKKSRRKGAPGVNNNVNKRTPEHVADVKLLMELFHRAYHEHNQDKYALAKMLGVSDATISNWLGQSVQPADRNLGSIVKFLGQFDGYTIPARFHVPNVAPSPSAI